MSVRYVALMQSTTFAAVGEPTRLRIVEFLRHGPRPVGDIALGMDIRQPQASKHLRVLSDTGFVHAEAHGRRRIYRLTAAPFEDIGTWVDSFEQLWETRLDALGAHLASSNPTGDRRG